MKYFILLIFPFFFSCYGTFRTAEALDGREWNLVFSIMRFDGQEKKLENYDSPSLIIRKGKKGGKDIAVKLFYAGFEFLFYKQLTFEENFHSFSSGVQLGIGYPILEVDFIMSKKISILTPYFVLKIAGLPKLWHMWGFSAGSEINLSHYNSEKKKIPLYLLFEYFYGKIQNYCHDCNPPDYGRAIGVGVRISF